MLLERLWVRDFRSYAEAEVAVDPGLTVVTGPNGSGKTNLLEAVGYLATQRSFRGHPTDALVRVGSDRAVVRAEGRDGERALLLEAEIVPAGRSRFAVNRQPLRRARDLAAVARISVFTPDDLELIKGGPGERRVYVDDLLASLHQRYGALQDDLDRILRQRNALLKSVSRPGARLDEAASVTLDVWDAKMAQVGSALASARVTLLDRLGPVIDEAYAVIADQPAAVGVGYDAAWMAHPDGLAGALVEGRAEDLRRGLSLVGPHRDDVTLRIAGRSSRTHASQGEQRTLALALRLAGHRHIAAETGSTPILLLDDVFSELDRRRCAALLRHLPAGQALLASAQPPPPDVGSHVTLMTSLAPFAGGGSPSSRLSGASPDELPGDNPGETVDESALERAHDHEVT